MGITILGGINQGLIWALLAIGVFVTFRILDFADLTVEGSFALGGLIAALFINNLSLNPFLATFVAMLAGGAAGLVTGLLNVKLKIPPILSGILTMTALVSINLLVTGGTPSIPVLYAPTVYNWIFPEGMKIAGDLYMWIKIGRRYRVCYSPEKLVRYSKVASNRSASSYTPERTAYSFEALYDPAAPDEEREFIARAALGKALILSAKGDTEAAARAVRCFDYTKTYRRTLRKVRLLNRLPVRWRAPLLGLYNALAWRLARKGL